MHPHDLVHRVRRLAVPPYQHAQRRLHDLRMLVFEVTQRCNLACRHCGSDCTRSAATPDLPPEKVLEVLREVARAYDPERITVMIGGGEPLLYEGLWELGRGIRKLGFPWGMVTNGVLWDEATPERARKAGARSLSVSRACTAYSREIPCRFTFEGEEAPLSVADNANSIWECEALVRDVDGEPAEADLGEGRFGDGVELERDGTSLETWLPEGAGLPPWTVQLWFQGNGACSSADNDYPLVALVAPKGAAITRISAGTLAIEVDEAGTVSSGSAEALATAWEDQTWHLFALSASSDGLVSAWLDGDSIPVFTHDADAIPDFARGVLRVGAAADGQTTWCGSLDDISTSNAEFGALDFAWTWEAATPFCLGEPL